jgi:hypothetical protein
MQAPGSGMFTSPNLDLCSGHSGSGVATADGSRYITAVVSGVFVFVLGPGAQIERRCSVSNGYGVHTPHTRSA